MTPTSPDSAGSLIDRIPDLGADVPAEIFLQESFWTPLNISLCVAALILLTLLTLWLYRKLFPKKTPPQATAEEIALKRLSALETQQLNARALSLELSLLLREYITQETQEPTLYETHQEFSSRLDSLASIPAKFQYDLRCLLEELSEMKYAGNQAPADEFSTTLNMGTMGNTPYTRARALITGVAEAQRKQAEAELKAQAAAQPKKERRKQA